MSKNRDLIYDMAEAPETEDFEQLDSEPCTSRRRCPRRSTALCASLRCVFRT